MKNNSADITTRCKELERYWAPRNTKMKKWYKLIQMVDELKTDKMESFVGNDPRAMFNLVLHMLDAKIPHRIKDLDLANFELSAASAEVSRFLDIAWDDNQERFRRSGPRQSLKRSIIGTLLATGWYSIFAIDSDDGKSTYSDVWNPAQVYPMWDEDLGLSEVAHNFEVSPTRAKLMARKNGWIVDRILSNIKIYDYWWVELSDTFPFTMIVWNAVVVDSKLVKFESTRFKRIPVYVAPVGGLPDIGPLSEGTDTDTTSFNAGATLKGERWKEEIGQSIVATNENIYRSWNKWWSFSLQLLRDTAQPRIFERSRSGKAIVKPEDVFRRGAIFRGGADDSVEFIGTPPMPLELRSAQLDLEAMMQRGGVSWAMYGNVTGQLTAYVMSQIAASANQVMRPFHQAIINLYEDIDNDWLDAVRTRGTKPYGWSLPAELPKDAKVSAEYEVEIPGDLVQRATVARMLDPDFRLSYSYVMGKLFPEIKSPMQERARVRADMAEQHPSNAIIALIQYYRKQAAYLEKIGDTDSARLFDLAADAAEAQLQPTPPEATTRPPIGGRPEGAPRPPEMPVA